MSLKSCNLQKTTPPSANQVTSPLPLPRPHQVGQEGPHKNSTGLGVPPFPPSTVLLPSPSVKQVNSAHPEKAAGTKMHFPRSPVGNRSGKGGDIGDHRHTALTEDRHRYFVPSSQERGLPLVPCANLHARHSLFPKLQSQLFWPMRP